MTDTEKLEKIARIVALQTDNSNDEEGDRHLADPVLAMEAIENVLYDITGFGVLRQYEDAGA